MNRGLFYLLLVSIVLLSCSKDNEVIYPEGTLGRYIADLDLPVQRDSLIACAASGQDGVLQNNSNSEISVFFYPPTGANEFRYYELNEISQSLELNAFTRQELNIESVLNGYLRRFVADISDKWCLVTFIKNDKLFISDPIRIKGNSQSTNYNPDGTVISNASTLTPSFSWNTSITGIDKIYFQIIADATGNLVSGTYTEDRNFTFYDLSNVILNIRDINPAPMLALNQPYKFVLMSVSDDNWVNTVIDKDFTTN